MKIEDGKPVLNGPETEATLMRDYLHEHGMSPREAARDALNDMKRPTRQFVEWLSQGTLTYKGGELVDVEVEVKEPANA